MDVPYNEDKFVEMVLHITDRLRADRAGGTAKLSKVLFFAEFTHVRRYGKPISGCEFKKLSQGPSPRRLVPICRWLVATDRAELVDEVFRHRRQERLVPIRKANLDLFTIEELQTIDDALEVLKIMTAAQSKQFCDVDQNWEWAHEGETIPYTTTFPDLPKIHPPRIAYLPEGLNERYLYLMGYLPP